MKVCTKCGVEKSIDLFYTRSDGRSGGYISHCKTCRSPGKPKNFANAWYQERFTPEELSLFSCLKNLCTKAKLRKNKDFDLEVDWEYLFDLWSDQNGLCAYSGLPLSIEQNHPHKVSLDRIDSDDGYTKGNLQLVSASVNRMKQEFNEEFFLGMCGHIVNHRSK